MPTEIVKDELYRLIDALTEPELHAARRFLEFLRAVGTDPVFQALLTAPLDDEPLTADEAIQSEAAWREYITRKDRGQPLGRVRQGLLNDKRR